MLVKFEEHIVNRIGTVSI